MDDMARATQRDRTVGVVALVLVIGAAVAYLAVSDGPIGTRVRAAVGIDGRIHPVVVADTRGPHAFLHLQDDSSRPVGFDPCDEVLYVVNPAGAPER
jgi:hypothetical protein